jgi:uncharacterized protein (TIGR00290 family)
VTSAGGKLPRAVVAWSSGKDSAWALHEVRRCGEVEVVGLLTTVNETFERVAMHAVRERVLDMQAGALGLACRKVRIPSPCPNEVYEARMGEAVSALRAEGVSEIVFGDLFLEEVRAYRVRQLDGTGIAPRFPVWGRDTRALAHEMVAAGVRAILTCIDPRKLERSFAGRIFDAALLADLPSGVDPCGENGEFHTLVTAGPLFQQPLPVAPGPVVERDGFVFADVVPLRA